MIRLFLLSTIVLLVTIPLASPHEDHGGEETGNCEASPDVRIVADYRPGIITVDGHADDWAGVEGFEFSLYPALDPDADKAYAGGKISIKVKNVLEMEQHGGNLEQKEHKEVGA